MVTSVAIPRPRVLAASVQRVEHLVRALGEQHRVVVDVLAAVHLDDLRVDGAVLVEAVDERLALEPADVLVVERDCKVLATGLPDRYVFGVKSHGRWP